MEIKSKIYKTNQLQLVLLEHSFLTILALLGSIVILFYIFGVGGSSKAASFHLLSSFSNFEIPQMIILGHKITSSEIIYGASCIGFTLFANLFLMIKKGKVKSIYKIEFDDNQRKLFMEIRRRFSNKKRFVSIDYSNLRIKHGNIGKSKSPKADKVIDFFDGGKFIARMNTGDYLWDQNLLAYNKVTGKIESLSTSRVAV